MQSFKVAVVAHESPVRSTPKNLDTTITWVRKARKAGAALVALPELGVTGHAGHSAMVEVAEPVPDGPSVQALLELAHELDVYISAGIAEDDRGIHYNTQFIVGPEGYVGKQRKVHLSGDEYFYFRGGTSLPVMDLSIARVGVIICYDNLFPEMARCLAVDGAELDAYGRFSHPTFKEISFHHLITTKAVGEAFKFTIWRDGRQEELDLEARNFKASEMLVPYHEYDRQPEYVITAGYVLQRLTRAYLAAWGERWSGKVSPQLYQHYRNLAFKPPLRYHLP